MCWVIVFFYRYYAHRESSKCLNWGDVKITRMAERGNFEVMVVFRNVKTRSTDPEKNKGGVGQKPIECLIRLPKNPVNLVFSVSHRLLALALRYDMIEGISTLDHLFDGDKHFIKVSIQSI